MVIGRFTSHSDLVVAIFLVVCVTSTPVKSEPCETGTNLTFLVDTVGVAIREAERSESANDPPRMSIVSVSISVAQQVKESDTGELSLNIPVFSSLQAAAEFSRTTANKIVQTLKFRVDKIPVSGATLSTNLIESINSSKKAMRHAVKASEYLEPVRMKFSQDFEVICSSGNEVSIVLVGYKGVEVQGGSNSITFEIEVDE